MTPTADSLARCDREIAEYEAQPEGQPAYLTTLGIEDWRIEKRLILAEAQKPPRGYTQAYVRWKLQGFRERQAERERRRKEYQEYYKASPLPKRPAW